MVGYKENRTEQQGKRTEQPESGATRQNSCVWYLPICSTHNDVDGGDDMKTGYDDSGC